MTRTSLNAKLRIIYIVLFFVLALSLVTKLARHIPLIDDLGLTGLFADIYDYMKDMALIFITVIAAYLANVFQKRSGFVNSLEREWRGIVQTKTVLYKFAERDAPSAEHYLDAYCAISATLDNMRVCYKNAGETDGLVGLYPFEPLHDMRRLVQSIDPRSGKVISQDQRRNVRDGIVQSFAALRENFLEELDLEQPAHPLLVSGGRRLKLSGAAKSAYRRQKRQHKSQEKAQALAHKSRSNGRDAVNALIAKLKLEEEQGKPPKLGGGMTNAPVLPAATVASSAPSRRPSRPS